MKKFLRITLIITSIFFNSNIINGNTGECIEISEQEIFIPSRLGAIKLYKDNNGFYIIKNDKIYNNQNCFCDKLLRVMSTEQLKKFLGRNKPQLIITTPEELEQINPNNLLKVDDENKEILLNKLLSSGYISVNQMSDGEYTLHAQIRLLGGGIWDWMSEKFKFYLSVTKNIIIGAGTGLVVGGAIGMIGVTITEVPVSSGVCMGAGFGGTIGSVVATARIINNLLQNDRI